MNPAFTQSTSQPSKCAQFSVHMGVYSARVADVRCQWARKLMTEIDDPGGTSG